MGLIQLTHPAIMIEVSPNGRPLSYFLPPGHFVCLVRRSLTLSFIFWRPPAHSPRPASDLTCLTSPICPRLLLPRFGLGGLVIYLALVTSFHFSGLTALELATTTFPPNHLDCDYR